MGEGCIPLEVLGPLRLATVSLRFSLTLGTRCTDLRIVLCINKVTLFTIHVCQVVDAEFRRSAVKSEPTSQVVMISQTVLPSSRHRHLCSLLQPDS